MSFNMEGYVDVAERIRLFKGLYPNGCLRPYNPAEPFRIMEIGGKEFIVYTAAAFRSPDDPCPGIAVAAEPAVGQTSFTKNSEVMNAETSAWGRAIVAALAADSQRIASADEVRNRREEPQNAPIPFPVRDKQAHPAGSSKSRAASTPSAGASDQVSDKQLGLLNRLIRERGVDDALALASVEADRDITALAQLSKKQASSLISVIMALPAEGQEDSTPEEPF
jgi:hypothetical protein